MDRERYDEMITSLDRLENDIDIHNVRLYLFGHCDATENMANILLERGYKPIAILDNNVNKQGKNYRGIPIESPTKILKDDYEKSFVFIAARAYASMVVQLKQLGYKGQIRKIVDYNSYADYSLSTETIVKMQKREHEGEIFLNNLKEKYLDTFIVLSPFCALGDIYIMMSYLPTFLERKGKQKCVIGVIGSSCAQVVKLYGDYEVERFSQKDMDKTIQAALFTNDERVFIPHQDRPYVIDLHKALYIKKIPLEQIYCCGVFGLAKDTEPVLPEYFSDYSDLEKIPKGKSVILSPYAKSVTALPESVWNDIVSSYIAKGYSCFTNVVGEEKPLAGTIPISPKIAELKSVVERAGTFIGIRSGLCDVLREAKAKKIALYPDYNYCDTKWKAIEMYRINQFDYNLLATEEIAWDKL
ncbi:MAG: hypothetical protein ACI4EX_06995 [Lachnospiraceae bacterium]